jgi:hypothetical protein
VNHRLTAPSYPLPEHIKTFLIIKVHTLHIKDLLKPQISYYRLKKAGSIQENQFFSELLLCAPTTSLKIQHPKVSTSPPLNLKNLKMSSEDGLIFTSNNLFNEFKVLKTI